MCLGGGSNGVGASLGFSKRRYSVGGGRDALPCRVVEGGFEGFFPVMGATCVFGKPLADGLRKEGRREEV